MEISSSRVYYTITLLNSPLSSTCAASLPHLAPRASSRRASPVARVRRAAAVVGQLYDALVRPPEPGGAGPVRSWNQSRSATLVYQTLRKSARTRTRPVLRQLRHPSRLQGRPTHFLRYGLRNLLQQAWIEQSRSRRMRTIRHRRPPDVPKLSMLRVGILDLWRAYTRRCPPGSGTCRGLIGESCGRAQPEIQAIVWQLVRTVHDMLIATKYYPRKSLLRVLVSGMSHQFRRHIESVPPSSIFCWSSGDRELLRL